MWNLPVAGVEPVSPALTGHLTTGPPAKSGDQIFWELCLLVESLRTGSWVIQAYSFIYLTHIFSNCLFQVPDLVLRIPALQEGTVSRGRNTGYCDSMWEVQIFSARELEGPGGSGTQAKTRVRWRRRGSESGQSVPCALRLGCEREYGGTQVYADLSQWIMLRPQSQCNC